MSLIRSSMIAGVTTGLLGIGAMTLGDKESFKQPYFWSATVSTAIVGGLAWAILHNEKIEETLDLGADAETFEAEDAFAGMRTGSTKIIEGFDVEKTDTTNYRITDKTLKDGSFVILMYETRIIPYEKRHDMEGYNRKEGWQFSQASFSYGLTNAEYHRGKRWERSMSYGFNTRMEALKFLKKAYDVGDFDDGYLIYDAENFEAESDFLTLAAEFAADGRKARRRSRLSWTRGFEPAFTDSDGNWDSSVSNGYTRPETYLALYPNNEDFAHYHIDFGGKTGTEGYHIHLWSPKGRPRWNRKWTAMVKSPKSDEWKRFSNENKGKLTPVLLGWYNEDIAEPEKIQTDGFMEYLISTGAIQAGPQLSRQYQPPIERSSTDAKSKGIRQGVSFSKEGETQIYFLGGDIEPRLLVKVKDNSNDIDWHTPLESIPEVLMPFAQMLLFYKGSITIKDLVSQRSINRFNKSPETWVKSYPAWFQSVVKNGIFQCLTSTNTDYLPQGKYRGKGQLTTQINYLNFIRWGNDTDTNRFDWTWKKLEKGLPFQVLQEREEEGVKKYYWHTPRPSTIRKMYDNIPQEIFASGTTRTQGLKIAEEIHYQCVQKYQPQKMERFADTMVKQPNVFTNRDAEKMLRKGFGESVRSGKMMCRRFKKNDK